MPQITVMILYSINSHYFHTNDTITVVNSSGIVKTGVVYAILSNLSISIKGSGALDVNDSYTINRNLLKG